jgi:hypothetical protein
MVMFMKSPTEAVPWYEREAGMGPGTVGAWFPVEQPRVKDNAINVRARKRMMISFSQGDRLAGLPLEESGHQV